MPELRDKWEGANSGDISGVELTRFCEIVYDNFQLGRPWRSRCIARGKELRARCRLQSQMLDALSLRLYDPNPSYHVIANDNRNYSHRALKSVSQGSVEEKMVWEHFGEFLIKELCLFNACILQAPGC